MPELQLHVTIDPDLPTICSDEALVINSRGEVTHSEAVVYPQDYPLLPFFHDLIQGRPFPLTLKMKHLGPQNILIVALFLQRDLAVEPSMASLVMAADLVDRFGLSGMAHIDREFADFFFLWGKYLPVSSLHTRDAQARLVTVLGWIRQYVKGGRLPSALLPSSSNIPRILDSGTNGFVVAEASMTRSDNLLDCWVELYRMGYLCGILFGQLDGDRRVMMGAKRSPYVSLNLVKAAEILNEAELAMGELPEWGVEQDLGLLSPPSGTLLAPSMVIEVLLRM